MAVPFWGGHFCLYPNPMTGYLRCLRALSCPEGGFPKFPLPSASLPLVIQARAACNTQRVPSFRLPRVMAELPRVSAKVDQSSTPVEFSSRLRQNTPVVPLNLSVCQICECHRTSLGRGEIGVRLCSLFLGSHPPVRRRTMALNQGSKVCTSVS